MKTSYPVGMDLVKMSSDVVLLRLHLLRLTLINILLIDLQKSPSINRLISKHFCSQSEQPWKPQNSTPDICYFSQTKAKSEKVIMMQFI